MEVILNDMEIRVLGCLVEKELTTPEYYPLSLNALTNACNQKSNRDPVMNLEEREVVAALDALRFKQLAITSADSGRVQKYRHLLSEKFRFSPAELAIITELLLRGAQTVGELRTRGERMHHFPDLAAVETILDELQGRTPAMVIRLARQPGRKESRYAHLFAGEPVVDEEDHRGNQERGQLRLQADNDRLSSMEAEVAALRGELTALRTILEELRAQFE